MYPQKTTKVQCLSGLIGIRTDCANMEEEPPFYLEDIEGVDIRKLARSAKGSNLKGSDYGRQIIDSAAREMMGDIELMLNNGYRLSNIAGDMCSTCTLLPSYTANAGIKVTTNISSIYQGLLLTKLYILANRTGTFEIVYDDGVQPVYQDIVLTSGMLVPVTIKYITMQKSFKVYFSDPTVGLGAISCPSRSSCGCGGSPSSHNPITITGLLGGADNGNMFGFLPCVTVTCSYDLLVCNLVKATPNIFGLALLYKIGEKYYMNKHASDRNNDSISYGGPGQVIEEAGNKTNYSMLYWSKMNGRSDRRAIKNLINDFLSNSKHDKCIVCDSKIRTAYVTG